MRFENLLVGHSVATVFEVLLSHAGYYVIPAGIERANPALRTVEAKSFTMVSKRLRRMPDFFVFDPKRSTNWLVEVKFRSSIDKPILADLWTQHTAYPSFVLILALAEPPKEWRGADRHIKAFQINKESKVNVRLLRENGKQLRAVFDLLSMGTILQAQEIILRIGQKIEE